VTKTVTPLQDTLQEGNETITLTLTQHSTYAVSGTGSATVVLSSDEAITCTVTVTPITPTAKEAGLVPGAFRFTRTGSTASVLTVYFTVSGTATAGSDYVSLGTSVTFPAGQSTVIKVVTPARTPSRKRTKRSP